MTLAAVWEDDWLVVVDKPCGLVVHHATGVAGDDLLGLARARWGAVTLLHRLDREVSGLVLLVKRRAANPILQQQLEQHEVDRRYLAILAGGLPDGEHLVDRPVGDRALGREAMRLPPPADARPARSHFRVLARLGNRATLVAVRLETGRKHQIRVHAAAMGHAILGDQRYGGPRAPRLALHAMRLGFHHPADGRLVEVTAPIPADLAELIADLGGAPGDVLI